MTPTPMALHDDTWIPEALALITAYANSGLRFSADDIRKSMRPAPSPNLVGTAFRAARQLGIISAVGVCESSTPSRKGGLIRTWQANKERV